MMHVVVVFAILSTGFLNVFSFNLDVRNAIVYEDFLSEGSGRKSYFGYSIVLDSGSPPWILIGAPRANFSGYINVTEPGVVVRCAIAGNCTTVVLDSIGNEQPEYVGEKLPWDHKDKAWIGASMDIEQGQILGKAVVCGHRWKDQRYLKTRQKLFMPGVCYWMESPYKTAYKRLPLGDSKNYTVKTNRGNEFLYGMAQAGSSVHLPQKINKQNGSKLLIGAPGAYNWKGTNVICEDGSDFSFGKQKRAAQPNSFKDCYPIKRDTLLQGDTTFPYIGYSVSSGKFFDDQQLQFVSGAPRSNLKGAVIIFSYYNSTHQEIIDILRGGTIGEYFGASITATDINGDGRDELIVGAPFFSVHKDEGRIYMFKSNSMNNMELDKIVNGRQSGSQFGLAVTSLGLLNQDHFGDIAVGAPYEGNGAVYIYNGGSEGLTLSQTIFAADISPYLRGFGSSLSNAADIDSNGIKDVAVGSYLSSHAVILRAAPVIILRAEIYANTFLIHRTTSNFLVHTSVMCEGCKSAHKFSVDLKLKVDSKYDQAFIDEQLTKNEYNEKLQFEGYSSNNARTYVKIFIKEDPDTQKDIELQLSIKMEERPGNIILIKKDELKGKDVFCKNCAVVDESKSQLEDTKIVTFVNACGSDDRCDASLQMKCSIKNTRYDGKNIYVVGSDGLISLEVMLHNNHEPAYSVTLRVSSDASIEPEYIPKMCKHTIGLELECEIGNIYNDTKVKNVTVEFNAMKVTEYAFSNENTSMLTFSVIVNTTSNNINNETKCITWLHLKNEAKIKIAGSSKPDYLLLKGSEQHVRHLFKAINEGPSPVKQVHFYVDVPTHYIADNGTSIKFLRIQQVQFYPNGKEVLCRYRDQDKSRLVRVKKSVTNQEEHTVNKYMSTASENNTLFLNCSSSNVICQKVSCSASEMKKNSRFDVTIDLVFYSSTLRPLMDIKSTVLFSTSATAHISSPKYMPMSDRRSISTYIVADKPYESVAAWIIILAIIGGILLLCLLVYGMKKAGFFRRRKKELLLNATLQKEADGQIGTD